MWELLLLWFAQDVERQRFGKREQEILTNNKTKEKPKKSS